MQGIATLPEIIWEVGFMGLWFTFKGFRQSPVHAPESREQGLSSGYAAV